MIYRVSDLYEGDGNSYLFTSKKEALRELKQRKNAAALYRMGAQRQWFRIKG